MNTLSLKWDQLSFGSKEAINRLLVNVVLCGDQFKKILITSSAPDEGKSFVAVNLWRALAESGKRVVMVDADIRRSVLRSRHEIKTDNQTEDKTDTPSLVNYLAGQVGLDNVVYQTNIPNAYMIPTFRTVSNQSVLLQNPRFTLMLDELAKSFDYVLLDTPPLDNVADAVQIASYCDGALLVVRAGVTPRRMVADNIKQLERVHCTLLGTVLNRVEYGDTPYYYRYGRYGYYHYNYYYYGHGEQRDKKEKWSLGSILKKRES